MKLHLEVLQRIVDLPTQDPQELRQVLDDLGLEVKGVETEDGKVVYNIETLANRGDHLFALGIAREFAARYLSQLKVPPMAAALPERPASFPVLLETEKCPRYGLLEMQLPDRMTLRPELAAIMGLSDRHAIVDTLNYIQLELGQPMHAFDKDKLDGEIRVELSTEEEQIEALDGKIYQVPAGSIMIKDRRKTVAVGGVIGCANSMVGPGTTRVLIESASFDPVSVRKTARGMGISTDASYLFERGCDAEMVQTALKRLIYLVSATPGVSSSSGGQAIGFNFVEQKVVDKRKITLRMSSIRTQLNLPRLNAIEVASRLKSLGYGVKQGDKELEVNVPSWRVWDVENEADLIEDFIRSHSLVGVKQELPPLDDKAPLLNEVETIRACLDEILHGNGFYEVIAQSFYSPSDVELLAKLDTAIPASLVRIRNAVETNFAYLKHSSALHMAKILSKNMKMGLCSLKIYEYTRHFSHAKWEASPYDYEKDVLVLACSGRWFRNEWRQEEAKEQKIALFKGVVESLFTALGAKLRVVSSESPFLHPGSQGRLMVERTECGIFGLLHPLIKAEIDGNHDVLYCELDIAKLLKVLSDRPYPIPADYPMIKRDLTLRLPLRSLASKVQAIIKDAKPENLSDITILDEFRKPDEDFRRVTYRVSFQSNERTLEHAEVDAQMQMLLGVLKEKHQIELA